MQLDTLTIIAMVSQVIAVSFLVYLFVTDRKVKRTSHKSPKK